MVSVDVKNCFDTINQEKLFEIVDKALKEDEYLIKRCGKKLHLLAREKGADTRENIFLGLSNIRYSYVISCHGGVERHFAKQAVTADNCDQFKTFASEVRLSARDSPCCSLTSSAAVTLLLFSFLGDIHF